MNNLYKVNINQHKNELFRNEFINVYNFKLEFDGDHHSTEVQMKRDKLKNSILKKADIPILRLPTTTGDIAIKIIGFFNDIIKKCLH